MRLRHPVDPRWSAALWIAVVIGALGFAIGILARDIAAARASAADAGLAERLDAIQSLKADSQRAAAAAKDAVQTFEPDHLAAQIAVAEASLERMRIALERIRQGGRDTEGQAIVDQVSAGFWGLAHPLQEAAIRLRDGRSAEARDLLGSEVAEAQRRLDERIDRLSNWEREQSRRDHAEERRRARRALTLAMAPFLIAIGASMVAAFRLLRH